VSIATLFLKYVTSPTGIREVKAFGGNDIAAMIWDTVEAKVRG